MRGIVNAFRISRAPFEAQRESLQDTTPDSCPQLVTGGFYFPLCPGQGASLPLAPRHAVAVSKEVPGGNSLSHDKDEIEPG